MPDERVPDPGSSARAERLRELISTLIRDYDKDNHPANESIREFIDRRMREIEEAEGE